MCPSLEIAQLGNPILRQRSQLVEDISDPSIQKLIDDLIVTAESANGVGIAAPQVSQSCRLFVVASRPSPRYPHAPLMQPRAMINPRILSHCEGKAKGFEGCLSIPGLRGLVPRYTAIEVAYCDRQGQERQEELTDFVARIFQHELDHLDGIVFLDRLESTYDLYTEQEYQRLTLPSPLC